MKSSNKYKLSSKNKGSIEVLLDVYRLRGIAWIIPYTLLTLTTIISSPMWDLFYKVKYKTHKLPQKYFVFNGVRYKYFSHPYNKTWQNERSIEIPLVRSFLSGLKGNKVLEVGNVLSHYYDTKHDVVDNYEVDRKVINQDIVKFYPRKKYDLIFSISTLEHVGIDGVKDPRKSIEAINHLKKLTSPKGLIIFTIPIGYNHFLDNSIKTKDILLDKAYFFKKVSGNNKWLQINTHEAYNSKYGFPFKWGNTILLGVIKS